MQLISAWELTAWTLLNIAFGKWWQLLGKVSSKALDTLWIKGIMNTSKAKKAIEAIQNEWWDSKTIEDLAEWFNARWFKWTKEQIVEQLQKHADDAQWLMDELLATSTTKYKSKEAWDILDALIKNVDWVPWQEAKLQELLWLVRKDWKYTASELKRIERELDNSSLNPYAKNEYWMAKKDPKSEWLANMRNSVKKLIEDIWEKEWLWNIKALNNEIVVANKVRKWISQKSLAEEIANWLKWVAFPTAWAIMWYLAEWDLEWMIKRWAWTYSLKLLNSTPVLKCTHDSGGLVLCRDKRTLDIESAIQKLKWAEKVNLTKWIESNWKQKLTKIFY